jgi:DNA integrity scanning protein DisA with diadenylate cyclase activity
LKKYFSSIVDTAFKLAKSIEADAILYLLDEPVDIEAYKRKSAAFTIIVAGHNEAVLEQGEELGHRVLRTDNPEAPVQDRLARAVLQSVADEILEPGSTVVAAYSGFDVDQVDSVSVVKLTEHLGRLTARDLQKLETKVPLETLKIVVDLAIEIGREGREGKSVGTLFVVGDHRKVLENSRPAGFDIAKGYARKERNLSDPRVREGIKEIAQLDGAFVISADGTVEACCRIIDTAPVELTMTTGLGARHFAGAAISKNTKAISIVVSESNGTVRLYQNGEVVLRIEPMRRAMKWKGFTGESDLKSKSAEKGADAAKAAKMQ